MRFLAVVWVLGVACSCAGLARSACPTPSDFVPLLDPDMDLNTPQYNSPKDERLRELVASLMGWEEFDELLHDRWRWRAQMPRVPLEVVGFDIKKIDPNEFYTRLNGNLFLPNLTQVYEYWRNGNALALGDAETMNCRINALVQAIEKTYRRVRRPDGTLVTDPLELFSSDHVHLKPEGVWPGDGPVSATESPSYPFFPIFNAEVYTSSRGLASSFGNHTDKVYVWNFQILGTTDWYIQGLGVVTLNPGDWVYVPLGAQHGTKSSGARLSISIGAYNLADPTVADISDLRTKAASVLALNDPVTFGPETDPALPPIDTAKGRKECAARRKVGKCFERYAQPHLPCDERKRRLEQGLACIQQALEDCSEAWHEHARGHLELALGVCRPDSNRGSSDEL